MIKRIKRIKRKASLKKPLHLPRKSVPAPVSPFRDEPPGSAQVEPVTVETPWQEPSETILPAPENKRRHDFLMKPL